MAGRPKLSLNVVQIKELAHIQCTMVEIAAVMGCSVDTLENHYSEIIKIAREGGKSSLRRAQHKKAMEGNPALLIWLGKHYLDQKESVQLTGSTEPEVRRLLSRWEQGRSLETGAPLKSRKKEEVLEPEDHPVGTD